MRLSLLLAVLLLIGPAFAHDHKHPDLDQWYSGLSITKPLPGGGTSYITCCNKRDCHTTEAELRNGEWWARVGKPIYPGGAVYVDSGYEDFTPPEPESWELLEFVKIPADAVLNKTPNKAGEAVLCHTLAWIGSSFNPAGVTIRCFVEPDLS